jgi:hypothetical protein
MSSDRSCPQCGTQLDAFAPEATSLEPFARELDGLPGHVLGQADLLRNKLTGGCPQDIADAEQLAGA